jgi:hypothetical protein
MWPTTRMTMQLSWPGRQSTAARAMTVALGTGLALLSTASALGQLYPVRPIKIVVAEAGGQSDVMGRAIAPYLERELGQPVVIDNHGGAGGTIGVQRVVQACRRLHATYRRCEQRRPCNIASSRSVLRSSDGSSAAGGIAVFPTASPLQVVSPPRIWPSSLRTHEPIPANCRLRRAVLAARPSLQSSC